MSLSRKRILVALHWYSQEIHAGVSRYGAQAGWEVIAVNNENRHLFEAASYDGIVSMAPPEGHPMHAFIAGATVPVVQVSYSYSQHKHWARCPFDADKVGRIAAKHMMRCPVNSFLFVINMTNETHEIRWNGFKRGLDKDCRPVARFITESWHPEETEKLAAYLKGNPLPLPIGIVGSVDESARQAYDAAVLADLKIPGDVYLMGCSNRDIYSLMAPVPITTVAVDEESQGYEAAALLDLFMAGKVLAGHVKTHPPGEIIIRESTGGASSDHPLCDKAISLMRANLSTPPNVSEIAKKLGVGKTTLNRAFLKILDTSVATYYLRLRLEASKGMLLAGNKMESVADSVGFKSYWAFRLAFQKYAGCTPQEFIAKKRPSSES